MKLLRYSWIIPFLLVLYVYGNETLSFLMGSPEHYEIVSGLGLPALATTSLVWLSVVIEIAVIAAVFLKPSAVTFSMAALWPWVPRVVTALTGGDMEMNMSLIASIAAMCAYMAYEEFRRSPMRKAAYAEG